MTSFVQVAQPTEHPGVVRAERVAAAIARVAHHLGSARGAAGLLLAALAATLLVIAGQLVDNWTEGRLLAAWIVMWTLALAGLALLAGRARATGARIAAVFSRWAAARRAAEQDEKFWQLALTDARIMADISRAMSSDAIRDVRGYY